MSSFFEDDTISIESEETGYMDNLTVTDNDNGEEIVVQATNNSDDEIDYITASVVFYKDGVVVGISDDIESEIKSGRSANMTFDYPYDKNYDDIAFDEYKVFINEAFSYSW